MGESEIVWEGEVRQWWKAWKWWHFLEFTKQGTKQFPKDRCGKMIQKEVTVNSNALGLFIGWNCPCVMESWGTCSDFFPFLAPYHWLCHLTVNLMLLLIAFSCILPLIYLLVHPFGPFLLSHAALWSSDASVWALCHDRHARLQCCSFGLLIAPEMYIFMLCRTYKQGTCFEAYSAES